MSISELYKKAYSSYLRSVRGYEKRYGISLERRAKVKKPTAGSIRALEKERLTLRYEARHHWAPEKRRKKARKSIPEILGAKPYYSTAAETEEEARIELQVILDMIYDAQSGGFKPAAMTMIFESCERLEDIISDARRRLSDLEIMTRLKDIYGGSLERLTYMIDSIIYAVYNKNDSGFAKWSGRGARAKWEAEIEKIKAALM